MRGGGGYIAATRHHWGGERTQHGAWARVRTNVSATGAIPCHVLFSPYPYPSLSSPITYHLLRCPAVQVDRLHPANVDAQIAVDAGTADAQKHAQIPGRPARSLRVAVHAVLVVVVPQHLRQQHLTLFLYLLLPLRLIFPAHFARSLLVPVGGWGAVLDASNCKPAVIQKSGLMFITQQKGDGRGFYLIFWRL